MAKVKELERQYGKLAGSIRLARFTVPIDMTQVFKSGQELARKLSGLCPEETIRYLMHEQALLPQYANIKKHVSPGNTEPLLMDMPGTTIDDKGYPSRHFFTEEERLYHIRVQRFAQILKLKLPVIHGVVTVLIEKERISKDTLREYVRQNSWLGKELCRESPTPGPRNYCWWDLLEPSLSSYFHKVLPYVQDRTTTPDLIIEIDSLCLKFEGIVRDLLKLAGASTFRQKKDNEGRTITEEKELLMLFHEKKADSVFFEEDLFFLKFVLVEKAGYNLRSRIAHCLMLPEDYCIDYMHLLLLALLKLAKYDFAGDSEVVLSKEGHIFHRSICHQVERIPVKHRTTLPNCETATKNGYVPCRLCKSEHLSDSREKVVLVLGR